LLDKDKGKKISCSFFLLENGRLKRKKKKKKNLRCMALIFEFETLTEKGEERGRERKDGADCM